MSIIRCDLCMGLIDTDECPETYDEDQDRWVCLDCREAYAAMAKVEWDREQHQRESNDVQAAIDAGHLVK